MVPGACHKPRNAVREKESDMKIWKYKAYIYNGRFYTTFILEAEATNLRTAMYRIAKQAEDIAKKRRPRMKGAPNFDFVSVKKKESI
jgi:hypothetical protein